MRRRQTHVPSRENSTGLSKHFGTHCILYFAILTAALVLLLYGPVLNAPFVYDDIEQIRNNSSLRFWPTTIDYFYSAAHFSGVFRGEGGTFYRPLFWLSLSLNEKLFGPSPWGFHLVNLILHWANGLLAFLLLRRLGCSLSLSAASISLWLILPVNSEAIAWISGRCYCLACLFLLLSLLSAERYRIDGSPFTLACYGFATTAALLTHEIGLLVLPAALVLVLAKDRRLTRSWISICLVGICSDALYFALGHNAGAVISGSPAILPVGLAFLKYASWILFPVRMSIERSTDAPANVFSTSAIAALGAFTGVLIAIAYLRKRAPAAAAGLAWFCGFLAPFSGVVFLYQGMAERYEYLASGGLLLAIVSLALETGSQGRRLFVAVLVICAGLEAWRLHARVLDWCNEEALYRSSLDATPRSAVLLFNLGALAEQSGDFEKAAALYQRANSLKPGYAAPLAGLGNIYLSNGDIQNARADYEKALTLDPGNVAVLINLGATWQRAGNLPAAEQQYRRAISIDPGQDEAYCDLGAALLQQGQVDSALKSLTQAAALNPSNRTAWLNLGTLYRRTGQFRLAAQMFVRAEQLTVQSRARRSLATPSLATPSLATPSLATR